MGRSKKRKGTTTPPDPTPALAPEKSKDKDEPNVKALKINPDEVRRLMDWIVHWRVDDLRDPCKSLDVMAPFVRNDKGYVQVRGTIINETARNEKNSKGHYRPIPATGKERKLLPQRPGINNNTKFTLHQLVAYAALAENPFSNDPEIVALRAFFEEGWKTLELSHLCHNKVCTEKAHVYPEPSDYNKSRNGCPVIIFINEVPHPHCDHEPPCIASLEKQRTAKRYTIVCEGCAGATTTTTTTTTS